MPRIQPVDPAQAEGKQKDLLDAVQKKMGGQPNILRTLAQSPAALESYLSFSAALAGGTLSGKVREQIALAVAGANNCAYCGAAHTAIGKGQGLTDEQATAALAGNAADPKTQAILDFAGAVVEKRGWVEDSDLESARSAGLSDGEIVEVIANVSLNIFTNYFNHAADTEVDFPEVKLPAGAGG